MSGQTKQELLRENATLRARLAELEDTLRALCADQATSQPGSCSAVSESAGWTSGKSGETIFGSRPAAACCQEASTYHEISCQFLANINHELRTPMAAILGMIDLALRADLNPTVLDYMQTTKASADELLQLLNELLDFSQLTAGKLPLDAASFDLRSVLEQTLEAQRLRASNKGLALRCEMGAEFPQRLVGDDLRLRQIVTNLISNAIKFTANGEIVVRVARSAATIDGVPADANSAIMLHFAVSDTGSMLVASDGERILTPFTKTHAGPTQPFGAAGLGLAVASSLVQLMHGQTWVESDSGVGSTLHFTAQFALPLDSATCDCADRASPTGVVVRPLRVLLAEDAPANQRVVATILRERGHAVQIAPHGRAALEALHQRHFDAVLMDIHMPIMDGFAATRAIRALGDPRKAQVPIIAVTAYALEHDRQRCLGAGMDGYLTKPVDGPALINLVERLAAPTAEPDPPVRAVGAPALSPLSSSAAPCDERSLASNDEPAFVLAAALKQLGGREHLLRDMAEYFETQSTDVFVAIRRAQTADDNQSLADAVHALKGTLMYLGAAPAVAAAERAERVARAGDMAAASLACRQLEREVARLRTALGRLRPAAAAAYYESSTAASV